MLTSTRKGNWWDQAKVIVLLHTGDSNTTTLFNVTGKTFFIEIQTQIQMQIQTQMQTQFKYKYK